MGGKRETLVLSAVFATLTVVCARSLAADDTAALLARGACTSAQESAGQALADAERGGAEKSIADALALRTRIALDCKRADTPDLNAWIERELALRTQLSGADSAAVAEVKLQRVRRAAQLNQLEEAFAETRALMAQADASQWPPDLVARITDQISSLHNMRAEAQPAYDAATRAIALARAANDDATLMHALENQAFALVRMRRGTEALVPIAEADAIAIRHFGANHRERSDTLRITAQAQRDTGNFGAAIDALEQSLVILRGQAEPDDRLIANALMVLGQTLKISGDRDHAAARYEEALAADARAPDPAGRVRPVLLHGLANVYRDRNEHQRAIVLYAEALPLFVDVYGAQTTMVAQVLNNYANALANAERYAEAIALYRRALAIAEERKSKDPGDYLPLANIAMIDVWQGRYVEAEAGFREVIPHLLSTAAGSEASTLFSRIGLAASLWGQKRYDDAFTAAVEAEQMRQAALRLAASRLGERQAINFQEYMRPSLDFVVAIAAASGKREHAERAWELAMAARDQVTSITAQRLAAARASADPALAPLWSAWRDASAALALAELGGTAGANVRDAQDKVDRAERALAAAMPQANALSSAQIGFADLRKALPAQTALIVFAMVQPRVPSDFSSTAAEERAPDVYAWILSGGQAGVRIVRLGPGNEIDRAIDAWNAAQSDPHVAIAEVMRRGKSVRARIWTPLAESISAKNIFVVPAGALHRVAWGALPDDARFLADADYVFHALNHERELVAPTLADAAPAQTLLAIADPSSATAPPASKRACTGEAWPMAALPGARREAARLGVLWHERFGAGAEATILEGSAATETRVRAGANHADVLHFATHGLDVSGDCAKPDAALVATRGFTLAADAPFDEKTPAASTTALMLAPGGGNGDDDGLLTAQEIAALDLSHTRWAVLAACATASGTTRHYEGLFGLARAFRLAGARTVITSLWPVEDAATAQWSEALYAARLGEGLDTAQALAAAQRSVLAARRARGESTHPYYWAAFVASGDWR
jgi:CHAT domain-containing protein/tetratricopeptide (TPR) repeat protein